MSSRGAARLVASACHAVLGRARRMRVRLAVASLVGHARPSVAPTVPTSLGRPAAPAIALVTSLVIALGSPQQALAGPGDDPRTRVYDYGQAYTAPSGVDEPVFRDGFGATVAPPRGAPRSSSAGAGADVPDGVAIVRPVAGNVPAAGGFGSRWVRGCAACSTDHQGLDFAAPTGTPVVVAMDGVVVHAGREGGYGNSVVVQHANGLSTRYGHLSAVAVRVGQAVPVGSRIGSVGSTGVSTGPHLHFEVIVGGTRIDPAGWLRARGLL